MALNPQILGRNYQVRSVKTPSVRLCDEGRSTSTAYADIITGTGVPAGGYGRHASATMLYLRQDASDANTCLYVTDDGGTTWEAVDATLAGADFGATGLLADIIAESTGGAGVTIDGAKILDGHIVDSVGFYDAAAPTKIGRLDVGAVTAGQTRVVSVPDANVDLADLVTMVGAGAQALDVAATPTFAGLAVTGDILHQGGSFLGDAEQIDLRANYLLQNADYVAAVGVTAGLVANYLPTATADTTVGAGVVTAGVDGVSDPTITTVGAATFAATDIVMISGSDNDGENDGIFEVQGHAGNVLTLKSTDNGVSNRVEAFTLDQVTANAGDVGMAITKITVTVLRTGADGIWEVGSGSQTGIVYSDLLRASDVGSIAQAYDASLVSLAALATAADKLPYATALDTYAETGLTAYARTLLDDADAATARATLGLKDTWTMAVLGAWAIDGDGANTNGAGLVGAVPTLTEAAVSQAKVENGGVFGDLSAVNAGYGATYQLFPDAPVAETDYCYFGRVVQFCEIAFDMSATVATFDAAGVLAWEYWTGAAWATLTVSYNGTSTTTKTDGSLAFGQDGALSFVPPADWAQTAVDGVTIFWVRCGIAAGKAANLTAVPITNAKQHEVVSPEDGFYCPLAGTITAIRLSDNAAVLHTTADVEFIVMNHTSGDHSGVLTFAMDRRTQRFSGLTLAVAAGDRLGVLVVTEDTAAEPTGCVLELEVTL